MGPAIDQTDERNSSVPELVGSGCPCLIFRDVLGREAVAELLQHVAAHEANFKQTIVRIRNSGDIRIDTNIRKSLFIHDLGAIEESFRAFVHGAACTFLPRLKMAEMPLVPGKFQIQVFRDGDYFRPHTDTSELLDKVRILSCVYYFSPSPRRFSGGELRLFQLPSIAALKSGSLPMHVDIEPEADMMVVFPSWLRHEVRPVSVPSGAWMDSRFSISCWLSRHATAAPTR